MCDPYAALAEQELVLAGQASDRTTKVTHLDRAAAYASQSERMRAAADEKAQSENV